MQQWEYMDVFVDQTIGGPRVKLLGDRELVDWKKGPHYTATFNLLGKEGWELVSTWGGAGSLGYFFFKRPITSKA